MQCSRQDIQQTLQHEQRTFQQIDKAEIQKDAAAAAPVQRPSLVASWLVAPSAHTSTRPRTTAPEAEVTVHRPASLSNDADVTCLRVAAPGGVGGVCVGGDYDADADEWWLERQ